MPTCLLLLLLLQPVELREGFLHDLNPKSPGFPVTLGDLAERLKSRQPQTQPLRGTSCVLAPLAPPHWGRCTSCVLPIQL
jgi:hypothetical protein